MSKKLQSVKGFYDVLPDKTPLWHFVEDKMREVLNLYAYEKINLPIVEPTSLFIESVGTHTDIVEKEMYSWVDPLNEDQLTLRPEGTAGCVRAVKTLESTRYKRCGASYQFNRRPRRSINL